jgi:hypothetical protein
VPGRLGDRASDADPHTNRYAHGHAVRHAEHDADCDAYGRSAHAHADRDAYGRYTHGDTNGDTDRNRHGHADRNTNRHADCRTRWNW